MPPPPEGYEVQQSRSSTLFFPTTRTTTSTTFTPTPEKPQHTTTTTTTSSTNNVNDTIANNNNGDNTNPDLADDNLPGPGSLRRQPTRAEQIKRALKVRKTGESGRSGVHPAVFVRNVFRSASWASRVVNVLWPVVPAAITVRYAMPDNHLVIFVLSYLAMVPCANLIGFAGGELGRKLPHVIGVVFETVLGGLVEIIMFIVLITRPDATGGVDYIQVIKAAILGSILATMLLCLGMCFVAAGFKREETEFSETVSEAGSGLLLTAGFGLAIPTVFQHSLSSTVVPDLAEKTIDLSRGTAVLLMVAHFVYMFFQTHTHHGVYDAIFVADEEREVGTRGEGHQHHRLTFTECCLALAIAIALVTIIAIALVYQIHYLVEERGISDSFVGLILVPLVEKAAEHLSAVDEAYGDRMNFALSHVLGATLQTALFNGPLVVIVGWGLGKPMDLSFEVFDIFVLLLAIITVGNFIRDQKSNYLEGSLSVIVYIIIAVAAFYYPDPNVTQVAA